VALAPLLQQLLCCQLLPLPLLPRSAARLLPQPPLLLICSPLFGVGLTFRGRRFPSEGAQPSVVLRRRLALPLALPSSSSCSRPSRVSDGCGQAGEGALTLASTPLRRLGQRFGLVGCGGRLELSLPKPPLVLCPCPSLQRVNSRCRGRKGGELTSVASSLEESDHARRRRLVQPRLSRLFPHLLHPPTTQLLAFPIATERDRHGRRLVSRDCSKGESVRGWPRPQQDSRRSARPMPLRFVSAGAKGQNPSLDLRQAFVGST
jgi:hypothetical protein